jgi:hypothetical protein
MLQNQPCSALATASSPVVQCYLQWDVRGSCHGGKQMISPRQVLGTAKNAIVVWIGIVFLGEAVTPLQGGGYALSLAGFFAYNYLKMQQPAGASPWYQNRFAMALHTHFCWTQHASLHTVHGFEKESKNIRLAHEHGYRHQTQRQLHGCADRGRRGGGGRPAKAIMTAATGSASSCPPLISTGWHSARQKRPQHAKMTLPREHHFSWRRSARDQSQHSMLVDDPSSYKSVRVVFLYASRQKCLLV